MRLGILMKKMAFWAGGVFFAFFLFLPAKPVLAGIYVMVDANGVYHFTNVPTSRKYHIFIGSGTSRPSRESLKASSTSPSRYESLIHRYARKYGVDTALVKAIIRAESHFNPYAVSKRGARGLMQLMPETARDLAVQDVFNPEENIRAGVQYLKMLLERFKGNLPLSLAAYNAGPNLVDQYGKIPPYGETRKYVKKVLTYYRLYR